MNPYEHFISEELRIKKKSRFLTDNKQHLCEHGFLHPMTALFNNHDISDKNMRCADCIKKLWDDMSRKIKILKELHALVKALNRKNTLLVQKYLESVKYS